MVISLQWHHNGRTGVSNHQPHHCLLSRLFRRGSKKTSKPRATVLCARNSPVTVEFPAHKWPVTRKMFPFDDVIMSLMVENIIPNWTNIFFCLRMWCDRIMVFWSDYASPNKLPFIKELICLAVATRDVTLAPVRSYVILNNLNCRIFYIDIIPHLGAICRAFRPWGSMSNTDHGGSIIFLRSDWLYHASLWGAFGVCFLARNCVCVCETSCFGVNKVFSRDNSFCEAFMVTICPYAKINKYFEKLAIHSIMGQWWYLKRWGTARQSKYQKFGNSILDFLPAINV